MYFQGGSVSQSRGAFELRALRGGGLAWLVMRRERDAFRIALGNTKAKSIRITNNKEG